MLAGAVVSARDDHSGRLDAEGPYGIETSADVTLTRGEPFILTVVFDPASYAFTASLDSGGAVEFTVSGSPQFDTFRLEGEAELNFVGFVPHGETYIGHTFVPLFLKIHFNLIFPEYEHTVPVDKSIMYKCENGEFKFDYNW